MKHGLELLAVLILIGISGSCVEAHIPNYICPLGATLYQLLEFPFVGLNQTLQNLECLNEYFIYHEDNRSFFLMLYMEVTFEILQSINSGTVFMDNVWMEYYMTSFADMYRQAMFTWEFGDRENLPWAWSIYMENLNDSLIIQSISMGINAHINSDLAFALSKVAPNATEQQHEDSTKVNDVLSTVASDLVSMITNLYSPAFDLLLNITELDPYLDPIVDFSIAEFREIAWERGQILANPHCHYHCQEGLRETIQITSAGLQELILEIIPSPLYDILSACEGSDPLRTFCKFDPWSHCLLPPQ